MPWVIDLMAADYAVADQIEPFDDKRRGRRARRRDKGGEGGHALLALIDAADVLVHSVCHMGSPSASAGFNWQPNINQATKY